MPAGLPVTWTTYRYSAARRWRRPALIDVWLPRGAGPHPSVLVVHGGGFVGGGRSMRAVKTVTLALVDAGFAVAAFDYRLVFRGGRFDEAVEDTEAAMSWFRSQADSLDLDPDRMSVVGLSAGAAIAMASAATLGPLTRLVGVYGPYNFLDLPTRAPRIVGRVLFRTRDRAAWERRSPAHSCDLDVPVALLHGLEDRLVPVKHTNAFASYRRERGLPVTTHFYEGVGHGFLRQPDLPATRRALTDLIDFLDA